MKYLFLLIPVFCSIYAVAQKLPEVQNKSIFVNHAVKIDGKDADWNELYEAENKTTLLQYKIANDENNLYLIFKSSNQSNIQKILRGGISFSISKDGKRNLKEVYTLTYPNPVKSNLNVNAGRGGSSSPGSLGSPGGSGGRGGSVGISGSGNSSSTSGRGGAGSSGSGAVIRSTSSGNGTIITSNGSNISTGNESLDKAKADSIKWSTYRKQLTNAKEIIVSGFKNISDSTLSIYNEYGIKVGTSINPVGHFIYEVAIPLNLINVHELPKQEFVYQIKVNPVYVFIDANMEALISNMPGGFISNGGGRFNSPSTGSSISFSVNSVVGGLSGYSEVDLFNPAEFWGKYQIQKK